jgi:thiamine-monophosphate kinase
MPMRIADLGEFGLIERIAGVLGPGPEGVVAGIGDDTAIIDTGGPRLLLATIDIQVEGRHFLRERTKPDLLGRRTAAINLSDIGAMGGEPRWALVSLALPQDLDVAWIDDLYRGLREELGKFGAAVIGGNLSGGRDIVIDLALLGEVERGRVLRREGALPGDVIVVTGSLGASAAGRHALDAGLDTLEPDVAACVTAHLVPTPRVREGRAIAETGLATAMLDLSDGLSSDLGHICDASGVGAEIDINRLPIAPDTRKLAGQLGLDLVQLAAAGGEDYELLFTVSPESAETIIGVIGGSTGMRATVVGRVTEAAAGRWLIDQNRRIPLDAAGWDHFRDA